MLRILATTANVADLFEPTVTDYPYYTHEGKQLIAQIRALRCRGCGWVSLMGIADLPYPHECPTPVKAAAAAGVTGLAGGILSY